MGQTPFNDAQTDLEDAQSPVGRVIQQPAQAAGDTQQLGGTGLLAAMRLIQTEQRS